MIFICFRYALNSLLGIKYFILFRIVNWLVGWLFWASRPFETVFQSISGRIPERGRKMRKKDRGE